MNTVEIKITVKEGANLPEYKTDGSAGCDVCAFIPEDYVLSPRARALIPTGLSVAIPEGYEIQVRPRSGLAYKNGITVLNSVGTIDSDYRGEVGVILINTSTEDFVVHNGDRIAQFVVAPVTQGKFKLVKELDETERGTGGFGSTGV